MFFKRKKPEPVDAPVLPPAVAPQQLHVAPDGRMNIRRDLRDASALRRRATPFYGAEQPPKRGMWVNHAGAVGILTDIKPGDVLKIMLTDRDGLNLEPIEVQAAEVRQAFTHEIPEPRRPDPMTAAKLGYMP